MYPRSVKQILMRRSTPHPATMATPTGGRRIVMRTMRMAGAASEAILRTSRVLWECALVEVLSAACQIVRIVEQCFSARRFNYEVLKVVLQATMSRTSAISLKIRLAMVCLGLRHLWKSRKELLWRCCTASHILPQRHTVLALLPSTAAKSGEFSGLRSTISNSGLHLSLILSPFANHGACVFV